MEQGEFDMLLRFFKALANENRLKMVGILSDRECSVEELAALLNLKEPTVSHHLAILRELGLVEMRVDGNTHLHRLDAKVLETMSKSLLSQDQVSLLADDVEYDAWEQKVLDSFFENGRLAQIPARRKKRLVILRWLASQFDEGVRYPERAVNELVKRYHPDCATIRRELIVNGLMEREDGVYWRTATA